MRKSNSQKNEQLESTLWKIDPAIDVNRISLEDVKLVFAQAEKRLDDTVKTGETISARTMSLMTIMVGILVALCGFFISNWKGWQNITAKDYVTMIGLVYIMALVGYMIKNVLPDNYYVLGSYPRQLMTPNFFAPEVDEKKITIFMYMSEIENYDYRIAKNLRANDARWKRYRYAVIALSFLPAILGLIYMGCDR
ncbi:MAG TPA: hypothetical protein VHD83_13040 [Puia sp.]|nr:hypothetical protein [Puia sp.]